MSALVKREPGRYTWEEKADAASKYMLNGNMRLVAELTGVPYDTLCDWKKADWWASLIEELRLAKKAKTGNKLSAIIEVSLEAIQDRLDNGDYILNNKTGEIMRKPVSLRDATQVTNQLLTRQIQMEELAEKMEHRKETVQDTLALLAREFARMNRSAAKINAQEIEYKETINAVHDQRETGLQEGSGEVHEQASS